MGKYRGKVFLFHVITVAILLFSVVVTTMCSLICPEASIIGVATMILFAYQRHILLPAIKERWMHEADVEALHSHELAKDNFVQQVDELIADGMQSQMGVELNDMSYCRTCGGMYTETKKVNPKCFQINIPEHRVKDEPPVPNPYAWWWFQMNGYEPPSFEPKEHCNPFYHREWSKPEPVFNLQIRGKQYYSFHTNQAWDLGFGDIPHWYVLKKK